MSLGAFRLNTLSAAMAAASNLSASGGTVTQEIIGGKTYNIHTFTSSGTFTVSSASGTVDVLLVGSGSTGGFGNGGTGGAGGAGGAVKQYLTVPVSNQGYSIVVGATTTSDTVNGQSSTAFGYTALGGKKQAVSYTYGFDFQNGRDNPDYIGGRLLNNFSNAAGGGGAGGSGNNIGSNGTVGNGGIGFADTYFSPTTTYYGGGGGAGASSASGAYSGTGGLGGGGNGANDGNRTAGSGTNGLGGGGGGWTNYGSNGNGGSGVVKIRYETTQRLGSVFSGTRAVTTGKFSNGYNQTSTATLTLPSGKKIGGGSAGTIEFWVKLNAVTNQVQFAGTSGSGLQLMCNTGNGNRMRIAPDTATGEYKNEWDVSTGVWYHIAITTDGSNVWKHYVNGSPSYLSSGWSWTGNVTSFIFKGNASAVVFDEIRFSNNIRYTASFTPATSPFVNDANTLALFHCQTTTETDDNA